ncbi:MAG: hypothetical protein GY710_12030 [Desulfobacteraceae bacterium]|nr:hypothetical protein [Desulfobacteraceae bacterium]
MKRMACILDDETVLEKDVCPVCNKIYYRKAAADDFFEYMYNGPHPSVGKYEGWDNVMGILCSECEERAKMVFGDKLILSLFESGDLDIIDSLAAVANQMKAKAMGDV